MTDLTQRAIANHPARYMLEKWEFSIEKMGLKYQTLEDDSSRTITPIFDDRAPDGPSLFMVQIIDVETGTRRPFFFGPYDTEEIIQRRFQVFINQLQENWRKHVLVDTDVVKELEIMMKLYGLLPQGHQSIPGHKISESKGGILSRFWRSLKRQTS